MAKVRGFDRLRRNALTQVTTPAPKAPPLLIQLIFTHIFGWTRGVSERDERRVYRSR
jgi:hypothetical protein